MKEKINQKGFIQIIIPVALILASGFYFGLIYHTDSSLIKEAEQLTKSENYEGAIGKLESAQKSILVEKLSINKQKIISEIENNKKLNEDKSKYDQGVNELNNNNLQAAVDLLSKLPEDSFYYQKAQTKIEESKRMLVEGELSKETIAKNAAEAKAKQEEYQKNLKTQELADKAAAEKMMNADNDGDGLTYREELALGTSDFNKDSDGDGIPDNLDAHPAGGGRNIAQTFAWSYGGYNWTWTTDIQEDWYDYYKAKPRVSVSSVEYVTYNDPFIQAIAKKISESADEKKLNKSALAEAFVQSLSYVDDVYTGYDEYPKYPVETFIEKNGDCEDTSYLTAAIVRAMNIDTVLILLPGHMAVGVWIDCTASGTSYKLGDRCYYYTETTGEGWISGEIPDKYQYTPATLIKIPSGETTNNISPQYVKPCYPATDFSGYYSDGTNYYSDIQCNNLAYCMPYKDLYYSTTTKSFYWDSICNQIVAKGCAKSTSYSGYFTNGIDLYSDSQCVQKATICRLSPNYSDTYYDGYNEYWDSGCNQKVVLWCPKSIYSPGYFYNSIDKKIYVDSECTILKQ